MPERDIVPDIKRSYERKWTIRTGYFKGAGRDRVYKLASVDGPEQREEIEVVPVAEVERLRGALGALWREHHESVPHHNLTASERQAWETLNAR
jgi:hypothetical protein